MTTSQVSSRYTATPELRRMIELQGRKATWMARQIGVSKAQMCRVLDGSRTLAERDARVVAALLGVEFSSVFEFPDGYISYPVGASEGAA
jgi:hypothetical protein